MTTNKKTAIIEWLFFNKAGYNKRSNTITKSVMTFSDIAAAISAIGSDLNQSNLANFWKDITRKDANAYWPDKVLREGWTGQDAIGKERQASFEFIALPAGQATAFPATRFPSDSLIKGAHAVQSLSIPVATKLLGRKDENWLAQVGSSLAVVETHFAVFSSLDIAEIVFLQTGVKLHRGEIDIAYKLVGTDDKTWLLAVEAKGRNENIHEKQLLRAAQALDTFRKTIDGLTTEIEGVIPFAVKVVGDSLIYTVEFDPITDSTTELELAAEGVIELRPAVRGIE